MSTLGLYHPGATWLHRCPAGVKLAALLGGVVVLVALPGLRALLIASAVVGILYAAARVPLRVALAQLRPVAWFAAFLLVLQVLLVGWAAAVVAVLTLVLTVALAALVTLTTRVSAMLDVAERVLRPLRRVGVDPQRAALVLALTIRAVPVVAQLLAGIREAQRARGLTGRPWLLMVPVMVALLRRADALGEALAARGVDDPPRQFA